MLSILKSSTAPSVRGSKLTADMLESVVLSRTRAARKNCVSSCCSTGVEPQATTMRSAQPKITRRDIGASSGLVSVRRSLLFFVLLGKPRDGHGTVVAFDVDQAHALRGTADGPDVLRRHAQDLSLLRDQHQLGIVGHVRHADHLAVPLGRLDVDDADAAARLQAVFVDLGPLAVSLLGDREDRAAGRQDFHGHDRVAFAQRDALHAVGAASHRAHVAMKISPVPSETLAAITASPSSTPIAMMPPARGLLNALSSVFLTTPFRDPITMNLSSSNSFTASSAAMRSPSSIETRFAIALPRPSGPTSGISWTFSQYARPRSEKIMM